MARDDACLFRPHPLPSSFSGLKKILPVVESMHIQTKSSSAEAEIGEVSSEDVHSYPLTTATRYGSNEPSAVNCLEAGGVAEVEGMKAVWGRWGKYLLWAG